MSQTYVTDNGQNISFIEIVDAPRSPQFSFTDDGSFATRTIHVAWANFPRFVNDVLGYSRLASGTTSYIDAGGTPRPPEPYIKRVVPWSIPFENTDNKRWLWATKVDVEGVGVPTDRIMYEQSGRDAIARYEHARCTIQYATRTYDVVVPSSAGAAAFDTDESHLRRYVTKLFRPQGEFLNIDGTAYFFSGATSGTAVPVARGINKALISYNLSLTWHKVPVDAVPSRFFNNANADITNPAIDKSLGTCNSATFAGFDQGTLLLTAVELKPIIGSLGDRYYDITYYIKFFNPTATKDRNNNMVGHQHVFRPFQTPGWFEVVGGSAGQTMAAAGGTNFIALAAETNIYNWSNFKNLFRPGTHSAPANR